MITDKDTGAGVTIDEVHHNVHEHKHYTGCATQTLAANTSKFFFFRTATAAQEKKAHAVFTINSTGGLKATLLEGASVVTNTGESSVTLYNNYRTAAETTFCKFAKVNTSAVSTTAAGAVGTRIENILFGGSSGPGGNVVTGGGGVNRNEWVLKQATTYAVEVMNANGANTTDVGVCVHYYLEGAN